MTEFEHINGYPVKDRKARFYNNVAEMKSIEGLNPGDIITTIGYYEANDGGGATYKIREKEESDVEDLGSIHFINDTLVAEMIIENNTINIKQFGAKGDGTTDDSTIIQKAINIENVNTIDLEQKTYYISNSIILKSNLTIKNGNILLNNLNKGFEGENLSNIIFDNIKIDGNENSQTGIYLTHSKNIVIKNCEMLDFISIDSIPSGIYFNFCEFAKVNMCKVYNVKGFFINDDSRVSRGMLFGNSKHIVVESCHIENIYCESALNGDGLHFIAENTGEGYSNNIVKNTKFVDCSYRCIKIQQYGITVDNCEFVNGEHDYQVETAIINIYDNYAIIKNCFFNMKAKNPIGIGENNTLDSNSTSNSTSNIIIEGNIINHMGVNYQSAIMFIKNAKLIENVNIQNNIINCLTDSEDGINLRSRYRNVNINGNIFNNCFHGIWIRYLEDSSGYEEIRENLNIIGNSGNCQCNLARIDKDCNAINTIITNNNVEITKPLSGTGMENTLRIDPTDTETIKNSKINNNFTPFGYDDGLKTVGLTTKRPTQVYVGFCYFDTNLNKPIWYGNSGWVDSTGTTV